MDSVRTLARILSRIEDGDRDALKDLKPGTARVIGLTGAPGVGKSTVTGALTSQLRKAGQRVGVLAIDPSSPFSGGALLGDRVRMQQHATDDGVFIRSMASRGHLGGLAAVTPQAVRALDAHGFDVILIETVGVGQAEVEVAAQADSVLVLTAPGLGDAIQAAKAGILETADLFVVNKADKPEAQQTVRDLRNMLALGRWDGRWKPPVITTVGTDSTGIEEVAGKLSDHWNWLNESGELSRRRLNRARSEILAMAKGILENRIPGERLDELARSVADGSLDPFTAAGELTGA
ncbi:MAG TPA: methylmalonyl Co-A mutase-associated GTPase MeaB [Streptosporangiaceae bacterium]|nr:methylmalonyl Co-A mutase-associated GTPase MeaB [Streptosporangiaceae bacterium]